MVYVLGCIVVPRRVYTEVMLYSISSKFWVTECSLNGRNYTQCPLLSHQQ
jgi:hypothetical protein